MDEMFEKRLRELAKRALHRGDPCFTHFMDMNQIQSAMSAAREMGVSLALEGGYPDAERRMGAFYAFEPPQEWQWQIVPVEMMWRVQFGSPAHRDFLGALMALGFERERIGDIVLTEGKAYVFAEPEMSEYIVRSLESVGRVSVRCRIVEGVPDIPPPTGRIIRDTVPSLRLDAVLASGFSLSRAQACEPIARGKVFINHVQILRTDALVREGDIISLRGGGRIRLESVDGTTKKGRLAIHLFRYGDS